MIEIDQSEARLWPLRAILLLGLGILAGLLIHLLTDNWIAVSDAPVRLAAAAFVGGGFDDAADVFDIAIDLAALALGSVELCSRRRDLAVGLETLQLGVLRELHN